MRALIAIMVAVCALANIAAHAQTWEEVNGKFVFTFSPSNCEVDEVFRRPTKEQQLLYVGLDCGHYSTGHQYDPTGKTWPNAAWQDVQRKQKGFCPGEIVISQYAQRDVVHSFREYGGCRIVGPPPTETTGQAAK